MVDIFMGQISNIEKETNLLLALISQALTIVADCGFLENCENWDKFHEAIWLV